jgi:hypothetical protein
MRPQHRFFSTRLEVAGEKGARDAPNSHHRPNLASLARKGRATWSGGRPSSWRRGPAPPAASLSRRAPPGSVWMLCWTRCVKRCGPWPNRRRVPENPLTLQRTPKPELMTMEAQATAPPDSQITRVAPARSAAARRTPARSERNRAMDLRPRSRIPVSLAFRGKSGYGRRSRRPLCHFARAARTSAATSRPIPTWLRLGAGDAPEPRTSPRQIRRRASTKGWRCGPRQAGATCRG